MGLLGKDKLIKKLNQGSRNPVKNLFKYLKRKIGKAGTQNSTICLNSTVIAFALNLSNHRKGNLP
jgi:hypothetical protein